MVFRFALAGHCSTQSACLKGAMTGHMQCSEQLHHLLKRCPGTGFRAAAVSSSHRGPHGRKVLQELQFSDREVDELEAAGVIRTS
jgi:hypothetical protein